VVRMSCETHTKIHNTEPAHPRPVRSQHGRTRFRKGHEMRDQKNRNSTSEILVWQGTQDLVRQLRMNKWKGQGLFTCCDRSGNRRPR